MNHFTIMAGAALVAVSLFGLVAPSQALQMAPAQRAKLTEDTFNGCVSKQVASPGYDASWTSRVRSYCACSTDNLLNEMTLSEAQQFSRTQVAPPSLQAKANRISDMCAAHFQR